MTVYTEFGYPALQKGGQDQKLIGYFQADTGMRTGRRSSPTRISSRALP